MEPALAGLDHLAAERLGKRLGRRLDPLAVEVEQRDVGAVSGELAAGLGSHRLRVSRAVLSGVPGASRAAGGALRRCDAGGLPRIKCGGRFVSAPDTQGYQSSSMMPAAGL